MMDELEQSANALLNGKITNDGLRTLCVFASEPIGVVDEVLEVGGVYQLSEGLAPLVCRDIVDYAHFEDAGVDALEQYACHKIAYFHHEEKIAKRYRKHASQQQEKTLAKKLGGKVTPGSGAFGFHKGDVKSDTYLVEAKFTDSQEYRLSLRTWSKIRNEAYSVNKIGLMEIVLDQNATPFKLILISPVDLYDQLDLDNDKFVDRFFSLAVVPPKTSASSVILKKSILAAHVENVTYNFDGKLAAFLIQIGPTIAIGLSTDDFIGMVK